MAAFRWKQFDGGERVWSRWHGAQDDCAACCCGGPKRCSDCGGRLHEEPVEGLTSDGWESVHSVLCEACREDMLGDPAEIQDTASVTPAP